MEATEAAWQFVSGTRSDAESLAHLGIPPPKVDKPLHIEILIETLALAGSPGQTSVRMVYAH